MQRRRLFGVVLSVCALTGASARAASLVGTVTLAPTSGQHRARASIPAYPGMLGNAPSGKAEERDSDTRDVVVYLTSPDTDLMLEPTSSGAGVEEHPRLVQRGQTFQPHVLGVPVGTTVEFPNSDPVFHNVFSYSKAKRFDLGKYGQGKSKSVTFDNPGIVKVFCEIHSDMTAYVVVADTPLVTQPDQQGNFAFDHVPVGHYELHTWHPTRGARAQSVYIEGSESRVRLNL